MKFQILFSGKDRKKYFSMSFAELFQRVVNVKICYFYCGSNIFGMGLWEFNLDMGSLSH